MKIIFLLFLLASSRIPAQTPAPPPPELVSLTALNESLSSQEQELLALQDRLRTSTDELQRGEIQIQISRVASQLTELRAQFHAIALATDPSGFEQSPPSEFNLQREVEQLVQPLLAELKAATAESREMETLRRDLALQETRLQTSSKALANLDKLLNTSPAPDLGKRLQELQTLWQGRLRDAQNQRTVLRQQIEQRERAKQSLLDRTRGAATGFVRTRGRNLALGVFAFLAVFSLMRALLGRLSRMRLFRGQAFTPRLFTLLWNFASILAALGAIMAVFNLVGDWFLLSLVIVFLLGIGWAGIKTLPQFMEQIRMMLNIGSIREGGRLTFDGIPWKVHTIGFATRLVNPRLEGGSLVIPTRMLLGMSSRTPGPREEWFPTREKDWILLPDGTLGRVAYQNPSNVQIIQPGGAHRVIPTSDFISMAPVVLNTGFRIEFTFGIEYRHQPAVTTTIPARMTEHLQQTLAPQLGENIQMIRVEFAEAADSSLNLSIVIDCKGEAAADYKRIPRWAQAALVDLCTRESWGIPFPQLQVHTT